MEKILDYNDTQTRVLELAQEISIDHVQSENDLPPVMICVLNGAIHFFSDLTRFMSIHCEIDCIRLKSYQGQDNSGGVQIIKDLELEERVQEHYKNSTIKIWNSIDDIKLNCKESFDLITSFHVFEHLIDPISTLKSLTSLLKEGGEIVIEVPSSEDALLTLYKSESFSKFTYWSQHLFLFNQETLALLVKKANLKLNWVQQVQRYGLSNHLYWLSNNLPGGQKKWTFLNSSLLDELYASQLASVGKCDTIMASISI